MTLQINALNIMCSNFWIATKTLKDINEFLTSMNDIYNVRVQLGHWRACDVLHREPPRELIGWHFEWRGPRLHPPLESLAVKGWRGQRRGLLVARIGCWP